MQEHWVKTLANSMAAKIIAFGLLGLLTVAVGVGLFTKKHVNILGIEFNDKDTVQKIVYSKPDTFYIKTPVISRLAPQGKKSSAHKNVQKIDSGGSGIQNNAPNYGNQAGRDINNFGVLPRVIKEADLNELFNKYPNKETRLAVGFIGSPTSEMENVKMQVINILRNKGYTNVAKERRRRSAAIAVIMKNVLMVAL